MTLFCSYPKTYQINSQSEATTTVKSVKQLSAVCSEEAKRTGAQPRDLLFVSHSASPFADSFRIFYVQLVLEISKTPPLHQNLRFIITPSILPPNFRSLWNSLTDYHIEVYAKRFCSIFKIDSIRRLTFFLNIISHFIQFQVLILRSFLRR